MTAPKNDAWFRYRVHQRLRSRDGGGPVFSGELAGVCIEKLSDGYLQLSVANRHEEELLRSDYMPRLLKCVSLETKHCIDRVFIRQRRVNEAAAISPDLVITSESVPEPIGEVPAAPVAVVAKVSAEELEVVLKALARARVEGQLDRMVDDLLERHGFPAAHKPRPGMIRQIQTSVAERCQVSRLDLISDRRTKNVVGPRQIAMYIAKRMTTFSLAFIGKHFGGRDHTTVLHAVRKVQVRSAGDAALASFINAIIEDLTPKEQEYEAFDTAPDHQHDRDHSHPEGPHRL